MSSRLDKTGQIANVVIAVAAVLTFIGAIIQGRLTAETLASAKNAFTTMSQPLVKFAGYGFMYPEGGPTCKVPATGINIYMQNQSGVPARTGTPKIRFYMGARPILQQPAEQTVGEPDSGRILAAGESTGHAFNDQDFDSYFVRLTGPLAQPKMSFEFEVVFSPLSAAQCFLYSTRVTVLDDCDLPHQRAYTTDREGVTPVPCHDPAPSSAPAP